MCMKTNSTPSHSQEVHTKLMQLAQEDGILNRGVFGIIEDFVGLEINSQFYVTR